MKFISKNLHGNCNFDYLDLFNGCYKIQKIYIATAFCGPKIIENIYAHIKNKIDKDGCEFKVYIDKYSNHALIGQKWRDDFIDLNKTLKNTPRDKSGIFLVNNEGALFHSKILYIQCVDKIKIYIGSMNYTEMGTGNGKNEEVLLEIDNDNIGACYNDILEYFNGYLDKCSENICDLRENKDIKYKSSRDFFSSGLIFFEYTKSPMFNFKIKLPESIKKRPSIYSAILNDNTQDSINILDFIREDSSDNKKPRWKNYTIETAYGYFTPYEFKGLVELNINHKDRDKKYLIDNIRDKLKNKSELSKIVEEKLKEINNNCNKVLIERGEKEWKYEDLLNRWKKWYDNFINKIYRHSDDSKFLSRYIYNIASSPMPNIWDDEYILKEIFYESFIDSISSLLEKSKDTNISNKFIQFLLKYYKEYTEKIPYGIENFENIISKRNFRKNLLDFAEKLYS